jgi:tetratricopeptide (TPR) repeat protein
MTRRQLLLRIVGVILIAMALLLGLYTLIAYFAWQSGTTLRTEELRQEQEQEIGIQLERAEEDIAAENFRLALRRVEWILEQDPQREEALRLQAEAEDALARQSTPQPTATASLDVAPTRPITTAAGEDPDTVVAFRRLERLVEDEAWEDAIPAITAFQSEHPSFRRRETDELLYSAYVSQGVDLLYGEQVELGIYYLDQAKKLGDLTQEVRDQEQWAELYLSGIGYYGVNWEVTLFYFRDLCAAAPFFHDACDLLHEALVAYGDQYAAQQEWCPATSLYQEAYRLDDTSGLAEKLGNAREACAAATPTPEPTTVPATPITDTVSLTQP